MRGYLIDAYKYLKAGCQEDGSRHFVSGAQQHDKGHQAQMETQEVLSQYEKKVFEGDRALRQIAQSLLSWRYSKPGSTVQHAVGSLALAGGLD